MLADTLLGPKLDASSTGFWLVVLGLVTAAAFVAALIVVARRKRR